MRYYETLPDFYKSKEWRTLLTILKLNRVGKDGKLRCEYCGEPIYGYCIGHHVEHLTMGNVNNPEISLNEDNIELVHPTCHNIIHKRFGKGTRHVYLVYGPSSEKCLQFVVENAAAGDTFCHVPSIRKMCTLDEDGTSQRTNKLVYQIRDSILDAIKHDLTKSQNCWIIGQYKYSGERERTCSMYGAEEILVYCDLEEAVAADGEENREYIQEWYDLNPKGEDDG